MKAAELDGIELSERGRVRQPAAEEIHANILENEKRQNADPPAAAKVEARHKEGHGKEPGEHHGENKMQDGLAAHACAVVYESETGEEEEDSQQKDGDEPWRGRPPDGPRFRIV